MSARYAHLRLAATMAVALLAAGCASLPPPTGELAQAEAALTRAAEAQSDEHAAPVLEAARAQLLQARDALSAGRHERARALALAAAADADLAGAQLRLTRARAEVARLRQEQAGLHSQLQLPVERAPALPVWDSAVAAIDDDPGDPLRRLQALDADVELAAHAPLERLQARQAVAAQTQARARDARVQAAHLAERRVTIAELAARSAAAEAQAGQLRQRLATLQVEAARREAERMRLELERARLQEQIRAEELARLQQQAQAEAEARQQAETVLSGVEQAQGVRLADARERQAALARQEAELVAGTALPASSMVQGRETFVLAGEAFASGSATLQAGSAAQVRAIAAYAQAMQSRRLRVVGHTDSQGDAGANQALSLRRAQAVRQGLLDGGLAAGQVGAEGRGAADPVADNATAAGRARNRRVLVILEN